MARPDVNPNSVMAQLARGVQYGPSDSYIAIMGVTGSGKSTFISRLAGAGAKIGHGLVSCTSEIEPFSFKFNDSIVHLIDTPGFDDTYKTDSDVLRDIVFWLNTAYKRQIRLSGIVYLHPITHNRVTGSAHKNLRMFHKLCGDASLQSVVMATTMWNGVEEVEGIKRQEQLKTRDDFWGDMVGQGSRVFRHDDSRKSAMKIVEYILDQRKKTVLQIQRQMVDEGLSLEQTSAGQEMEKELIKQREAFERRLKDAQDEMQVAIDEGNRRAIEDAAKQQEKWQEKLKEAMKGSEDLKVSMEKLLEQKDAEYKTMIQSLELERQRTKEDSRQAAQQVEDLKVKMKADQEAADDRDRRRQKDMDEMSERFTKENAESQADIQSWLTAATAQRQDDSSLWTEAEQSAAAAAVAAGGVLIGTVALAACNVM